MFSSKFKQCVQVNDPIVLEKIHQNFHITYLKDVVLLRYLDDATQSTLVHIVYSNIVHIVSRLKDDEDFLASLFSNLSIVAPLSSLTSSGLLVPLFYLA
jgi:protein phosphatase-4 regulatory subunit 3